MIIGILTLIGVFITGLGLYLHKKFITFTGLTILIAGLLPHLLALAVFGILLVLGFLIVTLTTQED